MKVFELTKHQDYIFSLFKSTFVGATRLIGWQTLGGESISRIVFQLKVNDLTAEEINLSSYAGTGVDYKPGFIYIFCETPFYICRTKILKLENGIITVQLPEFLKTEKDVLDRIKRVNENILTFKESKVAGKGSGPKGHESKVYVKRIDEDEQFAAMRTAPRMKTKTGQKCTVEFLSRNKEPKEYGLNDLSRGGAGVLVNNTEAFKKGDKIAIIAIEGKPIDPKLIGEVMSVRMHDVEKKLFKAGIKFEQVED